MHHTHPRQKNSNMAPGGGSHRTHSVVFPRDCWACSPCFSSGGEIGTGRAWTAESWCDRRKRPWRTRGRSDLPRGWWPVPESVGNLHGCRKVKRQKVSVIRLTITTTVTMYTSVYRCQFCPGLWIGCTTARSGWPRLEKRKKKKERRNAAMVTHQSRVVASILQASDRQGQGATAIRWGCSLSRKPPTTRRPRLFCLVRRNRTCWGSQYSQPVSCWISWISSSCNISDDRVPIVKRVCRAAWRKNGTVNATARN